MKKTIQTLLIAAALIIPTQTQATLIHNPGCPNTGTNINCCTKEFNIKAQEGYKVVDVKINGISQGPITTYKFGEITQDQTIEVITEKIETYTITYDPNGGEGNQTTQQIEKGQTQNLKANPYEKAGHTFIGWATSPNGQVQYQDKQSYTPSSNITLYAKWQETTYTITYNLNQGTLETQNPATYTINTETITLNNPTKTGHTFTGWTETNQPTPNPTTKIEKGSTGNKTYTANYTPNTYQITLDNQAATTPGTTTITATYGQEMPQITPPQKQHTITYNYNQAQQTNTTQTITHTFKGYHTQTNGNGTQYYNQNGQSSKNWEQTQTTTLYANWQETTITLPSPTQDGYTFVGWATNPNEEAQYQAGQTYTPTENTTLYGKWEQNKNTITIIENQGSQTQTSCSTCGETTQECNTINIQITAGNTEIDQIGPNYKCQNCDQTINIQITAPHATIN